MDPAAFAASLAAASADERQRMLARHAGHADIAVAYALKALFDDTKTRDPHRAAGAAAALAALAARIADPEIEALATWTAGIAALQLEGEMARAVEHLNAAAARFLALGKPLLAAGTQGNKVHALAMLGQYDEAIACGIAAREIFLAHGDAVGAGMINLNLGNIHFRREQYREAEASYHDARVQYAVVDDRKRLAFVDLNLANVFSAQYRFREATTLYEQALAYADTAGLDVMQAVVECNLGCLELYRGRYDRALDLLERSRRRYTALNMPHKSALAERELADAYLELNLAPEAAAIYERVIPTFAALGMRAEQAGATANYGRACILLARDDEARALLGEARALYAAEGNAVGEATVRLAEAYRCYASGDYGAAAEAARRAEPPLAEAGIWGRLLLTRWLRGEVARVSGQGPEARAILEQTLREANLQAAPQVAQRCETSLGLLAAAMGDRAGAEASFRRAVALIEELRAPLPAEEFRTAFVADKLEPYAELVRLCLDDGTPDRIVEALRYVERARSRALMDMLGGVLSYYGQPRDPFEAEQLAQLAELREELNWFYSQINRSSESDSIRGGVMDRLHTAVRECEEKVLEIRRQLQQRGDGALIQVEPINIAQLQRDLGDDTALIEYYSMDGELLAFVVTNEGVEVVRHLGTEGQAEAALAQWQFQLGTFRHGSERIHPHLPQLARRARHHLAALYDQLLRPIEARIGDRRLVVVPHRALHYVPFHALHDGTTHVIERREICAVPSANVLHHCLAAPRRPLERAVLLGVSDARAPRVRDEIESLAALFPMATALVENRATLAALHRHAPAADIVHLASHGQFRPDNPLFSSVRLADGWLTVRDAYGLDLHCQLVTLSACETGVNAIAPGDELIGLVRGFFSAGAPSVVVSMWTVDDATTAQLMADFYRQLRAGRRPAAALRHAQRRALTDLSHPYFWAPFMLFGRW